jgi:predicted ATP-grasp superfamily ATP-dependent carboligase
MAIRLDLPMQRLDRIPVLLLGGVNLVRSLGLAGIPAIVASCEADEPAFASRYCVGRCLLPPLDQGEAAIEAVVRIGDRLSALHGRRVPLMYGSDDYLALIYAHRQRLQRYFLLLLNDADVAEALITKDRFQAFAESRGLPVPRSLAWQGEGPDSVAAAAGPVLAKPSNKVDWHDSPLRKRLFHDAKARVFPSGKALAADADAAMFRDQLTFQEYVPGDDTCIWSFHAVADERGEVLDSFIGRKLRTYPTRTGESSFIELDEDDELSALGARIAAQLPLKGAFKIDFKKDPRSGRWYLLEINARFNLWHYLGASNGVNLPRVAYDYMLEGARPIAPHCYATEYRWLSLELDLRAFLELRARGELGVFAWLASILASRNVYNLFAWRDPGPWLRFWSHRFSRRWGRGSNRFLSRVRQWRSTAS